MRARSAGPTTISLTPPRAIVAPATVIVSSSIAPASLAPVRPDAARAPSIVTVPAPVKR
ncbi:hypothetical protein BSY19_2280 [Bosea sp. RAC05]|nr:hypothetical protein BSY19_2280 [Bosea sp. RAC05]